MSTAAPDAGAKIDLVEAVRRASPRERAAALEELVRLYQEALKAKEAPVFVWNADGLVTAILIPCPTPFDPNAHTKEPGYEEAIRREMEEVIKREGPPIKLF